MGSPFLPCTCPSESSQPLLPEEGREVRQGKRGEEELKRREGAGLWFPGIMVRRKRRNEVGVWGKRRKRRREKKGVNMRNESILSNGLLLIYSQLHFISFSQGNKVGHMVPEDRSPFSDSRPFPKKFWASNLSSLPIE